MRPVGASAWWCAGACAAGDSSVNRCCGRCAAGRTSMFSCPGQGCSACSLPGLLLGACMSARGIRCTRLRSRCSDAFVAACHQAPSSVAGRSALVQHVRCWHSQQTRHGPGTKDAATGSRCQLHQRPGRAASGTTPLWAAGRFRSMPNRQRQSCSIAQPRQHHCVGPSRGARTLQKGYALHRRRGALARCGHHSKAGAAKEGMPCASFSTAKHSQQDVSQRLGLQAAGSSPAARSQPVRHVPPAAVQAARGPALPAAREAAAVAGPQLRLWCGPPCECTST
jgi:hypothetical protein